MKNIFLIVTLNSALVYLILLIVYGAMKDEIGRNKIFSGIMDITMGISLFGTIIGFIIFLNIVVIELL